MPAGGVGPPRTRDPRSPQPRGVGGSPRRSDPRRARRVRSRPRRLLSPVARRPRLPSTVPCPPAAHAADRNMQRACDCRPPHAAALSPSAERGFPPRRAHRVRPGAQVRVLAPGNAPPNAKCPRRQGTAPTRGVRPGIPCGGIACGWSRHGAALPRHHRRKQVGTWRTLRFRWDASAPSRPVAATGFWSTASGRAVCARSRPRGMNGSRRSRRAPPCASGTARPRPVRGLPGTVPQRAHRGTGRPRGAAPPGAGPNPVRGAVDGHGRPRAQPRPRPCRLPPGPERRGRITMPFSHKWPLTAMVVTPYGTSMALQGGHSSTGFLSPTRWISRAVRSSRSPRCIAARLLWH